jgi:hypothetical protein
MLSYSVIQYVLVNLVYIRICSALGHAMFVNEARELICLGGGGCAVHRVTINMYNTSECL